MASQGSGRAGSSTEIRRKHAPGEYRLVDLGANFSPTRVNNKNVVAGTLGQQLTTRAAVFANGNVTALPIPQGTSSKAWDVNNDGAVVGEVDSAGSCRRAALFHPNAAPTLYYNACGYGAASYATGINDSGEIVGDASPGLCFQNAIFSSGSTTLLDSNGLGQTVSIDKAGVIAATSFSSGAGGCSGGFLQPVEYNPSSTIPLPPDATPPYGTAVDSGGWDTDINDNGTVVGVYLSCVSTASGTCGQVGFVYAGGKTTPVYDPNASPSTGCLQLHGINNAGQAVGTMGTAGPYSCAAPYGASASAIVVDHYTPTDLNTLVSGHSRWHLTSASDVNDSGVIVGVGTKSGAMHGFMLMPKFCPLPIRG